MLSLQFILFYCYIKYAFFPKNAYSTEAIFSFSPNVLKVEIRKKETINESNFQTKEDQLD